jgi:hypothetical protein
LGKARARCAARLGNWRHIRSKALTQISRCAISIGMRIGWTMAVKPKMPDSMQMTELMAPRSL